MTTCQRCKQRPAVWAVQDVAGEFTVTTLGSHYRGFKVVKMCDECKTVVQSEQSVLTEVGGH